MKYKGNYSSINQVAAIDEKKVNHLGRNYASIFKNCIWRL